MPLRGDGVGSPRPYGWTNLAAGSSIAAVDVDRMRLLERVERYYDAAPRPAAQTEEVGPFTLFISPGGWPYYGRPRLGLSGAVGASDVQLLRARQRELGVPEALEWVHETTPSLLTAARDAGLAVRAHPLMVLEHPLAVKPPAGMTVRLIHADDAVLAPAQAVQHLGFSAAGTAVGAAGPAERDAAVAAGVDASTFDQLRWHIRAAHTVMGVVEDGEGCIAAGNHNQRGDATEIVGVATLPAARRRGAALALTALLVQDARQRGADLVLLSAGSEDVARIYARAGFTTIGTAHVAEPAAPR